MSKYIDADCLIKELEEQKQTCKSTASTMLLDYMIGLLRVIPAEDVAPVVHGEWRDIGDYGWQNSYCSVCDKYSDIKGIKPIRHKSYCPNCGAKMDGGDQ